MTEKSKYRPSASQPIPQPPRLVLSVSHVLTSSSEWYSQCIPTEDAEELAQNPDVETQIITTRFDVPGPTPSVVTTYITIYTPAPQPTPEPQPEPPIVITVVPDTPINGKRRRLNA